MAIDRIEGGLVVIEVGDGSFIEVASDRIEGRVREGAVLVDEGGVYRVDEDATEIRSRRISGKRRRLFWG
ncbi:MAG: DUF3006 domain-containing protein [Coriobacteriaceae bacterium]|nr:DUF3006 domain-containing protein [Coriobacteriaceae bacterium]